MVSGLIFFSNFWPYIPYHKATRMALYKIKQKYILKLKIYIPAAVAGQTLAGRPRADSEAAGAVSPMNLLLAAAVGQAVSNVYLQKAWEDR